MLLRLSLQEPPAIHELLGTKIVCLGLLHAMLSVLPEVTPACHMQHLIVALLYQHVLSCCWLEMRAGLRVSGL